MSIAHWRKIVVAVRVPEARQQPALSKAAKIAQRCGARLTLLHVFSLPYPLPVGVGVSSTKILRAAADQRRAELEVLAKPLRAEGLKVDTVVSWDFPAAEAVVRHVMKSKADLLVAESHGHSRVGRWLLANTDWEMIRECPCPVWFVKHARLPAAPRFLISVDPTHAHAKPSRLDERLAATASAAQQQIGGRLAFVHAEEALRGLFDGQRSPLPVPLDTLVLASARERAAARASIERLAVRHGAPKAPRIVHPGAPAEVIARAAEETLADVLVLGAVSRRRRERPFIGTTAERIIDTVDTDLLVVKPAGFRTSVSRRAVHLHRA